MKSEQLSLEIFSNLLLSCLRNENYHCANSMTLQTEQVELGALYQHLPGTVLLDNQLSELETNQKNLQMNTIRKPSTSHYYSHIFSTGLLNTQLIQNTICHQKFRFNSTQARCKQFEVDQNQRQPDFCCLCNTDISLAKQLHRHPVLRSAISGFAFKAFLRHTLIEAGGLGASWCLKSLEQKSQA